MARKKRGWWSQIQSNDYPESQKKYGDKDWIAFNIEKDKHIEPRHEEVKGNKPPLILKKRCSNCGNLLLDDKEKCNNCGWEIDNKNYIESKIINEINYKRIIQDNIKKDAPKVNYTILCPKCGSKMVLRTAKKGKNKGNKFWGCSQFPKCRGTSSYREIF